MCMGLDDDLRESRNMSPKHVALCTGSRPVGEEYVNRAAQHRATARLKRIVPYDLERNEKLDPMAVLEAIGNNNARAQTMGVDTRTFKDINGKAFGQELYDGYQKPESQITEVSYMWVRPGPDKTPAPKVSFVTRVGDLGCGVGYYK
jgi:hypothetical protein